MDILMIELAPVPLAGGVDAPLRIQFRTTARTVRSRWRAESDRPQPVLSCNQDPETRFAAAAVVGRDQECSP